MKKLVEGWVKSNVTVGHDDAYEQKVDKPVKVEEILDEDDDDDDVDDGEKRHGFEKVFPYKLVVEPERNMLNAAEVVFAVNLASGGSE